MSAEMSYPALMPYLTVRHAKKAIEFYQKAFGFQYVAEESKSNDQGDLEHVTMHLGQAVIMFGPEGAWGHSKAPISQGIEPPINLYVYCENVDLLYEKAVENGAKSLDAPADMFWGDRMCRLVDIDGFHWSFASRK